MSSAAAIKLPPQASAPTDGSLEYKPSVSRGAIPPSDTVFNSPPVTNWVRTVYESSEDFDASHLPERASDFDDPENVFNNLIDPDESDEDMPDSNGIAPQHMIALLHLLNIQTEP